MKKLIMLLVLGLLVNFNFCYATEIGNDGLFTEKENQKAGGLRDDEVSNFNDVLKKYGKPTRTSTFITGPYAFTFIVWYYDTVNESRVYVFFHDEMYEPTVLLDAYVMPSQYVAKKPRD